MRKIILSAILFPALFSNQGFAENWVDDWFDAATYNGADSFEAQNRHFVSGGSFSVRSRVKTDYPITISMPKISSGCGGIDGFMGGFSFLDADYLVDKAQRMMQAAPYIAVDMALKTMSKEFSDTIKAAEDIVSQLNGIQLNECTSMKPVVTAALNQDAEGTKQALGEIVNAKQIRESTSRLWQEAKETTVDADNKSPVDLSTEIEGCPADVKEIFGGGSVIQKVADKSNMGDHADLIRGYFGDVVINNSNNLITPELILPCPQNTDDHEGFLYGGSYERDITTGACTISSGKTVHEAIYEKIQSIASKIENNQALSDDDKAFAGEGTQLPIFRMLQVALERGTLSETVTVLTDITSAAYAAKVADTFYFETYSVIKRVSEASQSTTQEDNDKPCNMRVLGDAAGKVRDLLRDVRETRRSMMNNVMVSINQHTQFEEIVAESRRRMREHKMIEARKLSGVSQ